MLGVKGPVASQDFITPKTGELEKGGFAYCGVQSYVISNLELPALGNRVLTGGRPGWVEAAGTLGAVL